VIRTPLSDNGKLSGRLTAKSQLLQSASRIASSLGERIPSSQVYNLTISEPHKFVWFRVAKVGTRTLFEQLDANHAQLTARHPMGVYYSRRMYDDYFKFAFVRDPWARLVSCWRNKVIDNNYFDLSSQQHDACQSFGTFVEWVATLNLELCDHHIRLQSNLIDLNNLDFLGRFENFDDDALVVFNRLGMTYSPRQIANKSSGDRHFSSYYTKSIVERVGELFEKDIRTFGYLPPSI